jgi:YD repeat-containing protein
MFLRPIFAAIILFTTVQATALVDMKNANFSDYWVDLVIPGNGFDLKITRNYSSRSLFSGIFGFGWCSNLETSLTITMEGNLVMNECAGGLSVSFYPANYNTKIINDSVNRVIALLKKKQPDKTKKFFLDLADQLRSDHKLRTELAGEVGVKIIGVKDTVYLANGKEIDRITFDGTYYVRNLPDGTAQKFDSKGHLVFIYDRAKNYMKIHYTNDIPAQVIDNAGRKLSFIYGPEKKIKQIVGSNGLMVNYKFSGENLTNVTNAWKNSYIYNYDSNHNLTRIQFPDGTAKKISYVESKDWVKEFVDRDGCVESFDFILSADNPKDHYSSTSAKVCKGKTVSKSRFEFWYQMRPDREKYLNRVYTERNNDLLDIFYHQDFGKPISVRRNGDVTTLQYTPTGLVKTKTVAWNTPQPDDNQRYTLAFTYDTNNHIVETNADYFNKAGKLIKKRKTNFQYDSQGRLASARSSEGQFVKITYNLLGLIAGITDQAKKDILIEYDKVTQKPSTITRPSVGSIQLSYGAAGEIKKVRNKGGPSVNTQVYATFNNFLDMVGPASSELNLNL